MLLQLGPGQALSKSPLKMCGLQPLEVNLGQVTHYSTVQYSTVQHSTVTFISDLSYIQVGWGRRVISPTTYTANYCSGACSFPLSQVYCYLTYPGCVYCIAIAI